MIPLHTHSTYSLMDSVTSPSEWIIFCAENSIPAIAITDHGTLVALYDILQAGKIVKQHNEKNKTSLPSVVGIPACEFYVRTKSESAKHHYHLNVYAVSQEGLLNLCHHGSEAWKDQISIFGNVKPRVQWDDIKKNREGLRFGSACLGSYIGIEWEADPIRGEEAFKRFIRDFGSDSFIEFIVADITYDWDSKAKKHRPIEPKPHYPDGNKQAGFNRFLYQMIKKHGGIPIPTLDAHFIKPEEKVLQDIVLKNGLDNGWFFHESAHFRNSDESFEILKRHIPELTEEEFTEWIENTYQMIEPCKNIKIDNSYKLPNVDLPEDIAKSDCSYDEKLTKYLITKVKEHGRWNNDVVYRERFKKEVEVICNSVGPDEKRINFLPYFFLYEEIGRIARETGTLQNLGRGSAGGSLVAYYLKITHIDPIATNLPFERFLSTSRIHGGSFPDIDADFGNRKPIIEYLQNKYGIGFSQIATYQTFKAASALKGIMFAFYGKQQNDAEMSLVTKNLKAPTGVSDYDYIFGYTDRDGNYHKGEIEINEMFRDYLNSYEGVLEVLDKVLGLPKGLGRHASAYVISSLDIPRNGVPVAYLKTAKGDLVKATQFDGPKMEKLGYIKADILGLTTICVLDECMARVKETTGKNYLEEDSKGVALVYRLPEDKEVFKDIMSADTLSVFQIGTPTTWKYLPQFKPESKEMISDFTALVRPGALDAVVCNSEVTMEEKLSATQYYIDVRNGDRKLAYIHPDLEPYQTRGVFVYQEQIMALFVGLADYSLEEADQIRTAIAKKKKEKMESALGKLEGILLEKNWTPEQISALVDQIKSFSSYSFNRSHARCYGEMAYITAYMKHYHPLEWWASVLGNEDKPEKVRTIVEYLGPKKLISSVSLLESSNKWRISNGRILAPYHSVFRIGESVSDSIEACKPFSSLKELMDKVKEKGFKINVGHLAAIAMAGAFEAQELFDIVPKSKSKAVQKLKDEYSSAARRYLCRRTYDLMFHISTMNSFLLKDLVKNDKLASHQKGDGNIFFYVHGDTYYTVHSVSSLPRIPKETKVCFVGVVSRILPQKKGISKSGKAWEKNAFELDGGDGKTIISYWGDNELTVKEKTFVYVIGKVKYSDYWKTNELEVTKVIEIRDALELEDFTEEKMEKEPEKQLKSDSNNTEGDDSE